MTLAEYFILSIFIFLGLFSLVAALFNFEWYFKTNNAMTIINWLGRTGARVFYGLLGLALIICGIAGFVSWS
ncbi:immunity 17 family protein [Parabacteroides sp. OttesenSCG-928-G07]|nr:immunity 17 family protein [Parabacteroides sp. OttesenSCG-928-G07]